MKGLGYADVENKLPAKVESAYRLASITKTFTGAAVEEVSGMPLGDYFRKNIFAALKDTFNYGSLHFERTCQPFAAAPQELAEAFAYLNRAASRSALSADYASTQGYRRFAPSDRRLGVSESRILYGHEAARETRRWRHCPL